MPQRYRTLRWVRQWDDLRVVWISVAKLDCAWRKDGDLLPDGPYGGRYAGVGKFLELHAGTIWMPTVSPLGDAVSFTDGRHRFAWMRDHGVKYMAVATGPTEREPLRAMCGTRSRASKLPLPICLRLQQTKTDMPRPIA